MTDETINTASIGELQEKTAVAVQASAIGLVVGAEIDQQIATAHKYPRSVTTFRSKAMTLATLNDEVASDCLFALPRDGKTIEGPSIRLAEIIVSCWGNCRTASRIVHEGDDYIVAQGIFHDLENNVAIQKETQRRIRDKNNRRYKLDMILTTGNAAQSIAMRNAIVAGVPRAIWNDVYQAARQVAAGDARSIATRRAGAIAKFATYGVDLPAILRALQRNGEEEIDRDDIVRMIGMYSAIRDNESTIEELFPPAPLDIRKTARTDTADGGKTAAELEAAKAKAAEGLAAMAEKSDKPATQTVAGASAGDQGGFGTPEVAHAAETAKAAATDPIAEIQATTRKPRRTPKAME